MSMMNLIELRQPRNAVADDLAGLQGYLAQLIGEPFRFARVSYGDELTIHFGDLRPARSPKLKNHSYGSYILGVRGSSWVLKSELAAQLLTAGFDPDAIADPRVRPFRKEDLESSPLIQPESRVLSATPFIARPLNGFGLQLRVSDGSSLLIKPVMPEAEEPGDESLLELADWELATPSGLLSAGPGLVWSFKPTARP